MANQTSGCDTQFGGRIQLTIGGQQFPASDGDIKMTVSNLDVSSELNSDGTLCRKIKLMPFKWEITFRERSGIVWQTNMSACSIDATAAEQDNGRTHLLTGATFTGSPVYNTATGEISGVALEAGANAYTRL